MSAVSMQRVRALVAEYYAAERDTGYENGFDYVVCEYPLDVATLADSVVDRMWELVDAMFATHGRYDAEVEY